MPVHSYINDMTGNVSSLSTLNKCWIFPLLSTIFVEADVVVVVGAFVLLVFGCMCYTIRIDLSISNLLFFMVIYRHFMQIGCINYDTINILISGGLFGKVVPIVLCLLWPEIFPFSVFRAQMQQRLWEN